jgi:pSer/pThr/pTyr-binding forkhead associated (FHA) protein
MAIAVLALTACMAWGEGPRNVTAAELEKDPLGFLNTQVALEGMPSDVRATGDGVSYTYTLKDTTGAIDIVANRPPQDLSKACRAIGAVQVDRKTSKPYVLEKTGPAVPAWLLGTIAALVVVILVCLVVLLRAPSGQRARRAFVGAGAPMTPGAGGAVAGGLLAAGADGAWGVATPRTPKRKTVIGGQGIGTLTAERGPDAGLSFTVFFGKTIIGADPECHVLAGSSDPMLSSKHAEILTSVDGKCVIVDTGSTNGTIVNGSVVHEAVLKDGDVVEVGATRMLLHLDLPQAGAQAIRAGARPVAQAARVAPSRPTVVTGQAAPDAASKDSAGGPATAMYYGAELAVVEGPDAGSAVAITKREFTVGRKEDRDFRLTDDTVSRNQATILVLDGDKFVLRNESNVGTKVNDSNVEQAELKNGDRIKVGATVLEFRRGS